MNPQILTIGFDGPNRAGKGTQCQYLHDWFCKHHIPTLIVRGAGSRTGLGQTRGDPVSVWWQDVNKWLRSPSATYQDWDVTSLRLARELIVWRERILPNCARKNGCELAVLIVDRTLLSRTITVRARQIEDVANNLYPHTSSHNKSNITAELVCPDIILNIIAPKQALLSRLSTSDPKYAFRKRLIEEKADWFDDAAEFIPAQLRSRVRKIDGSVSAEDVFANIMFELQNRFCQVRELSITGHDER